MDFEAHDRRIIEDLERQVDALRDENERLRDGLTECSQKLRTEIDKRKAAELLGKRKD